jgi:DNA adenine methylase
MAIITPFRYPGSKNKLLPVLMEHIDKTLVGKNEFCDAFVGGGSVLLEVANKYSKLKLYANDKDQWVASFWQVVADNDSTNLKELLGLMEAQPTLELFYKLRETPPVTIVESAYRAIFFNRTTFSGIFYSGPIGGKGQKSKYPVDCRYNFKKLKAKTLVCHELLKGRTAISNLDFSDYDILTGTDYPLYLDPPYYVKGDILYIERMKPAAHEELAKMLDSRTNWVLSYDDCPEIRKFYQNKQIIDLSARYCINGKKDNWESKNELIILGD